MNSWPIFLRTHPPWRLIFDEPHTSSTSRYRFNYKSLQSPSPAYGTPHAQSSLALAGSIWKKMRQRINLNRVVEFIGFCRSTPTNISTVYLDSTMSMAPMFSYSKWSKSKHLQWRQQFLFLPSEFLELFFWFYNEKRTNNSTAYLMPFFFPDTFRLQLIQTITMAAQDTTQKEGLSLAMIAGYDIDEVTT